MYRRQRIEIEFGCALQKLIHLYLLFRRLTPESQSKIIRKQKITIIIELEYK